MSYRFKKGTIQYLGEGIAQDETEVTYDGAFIWNDENTEPLLVWDEILQNVRELNAADILEKARINLIYKLQFEGVRRANLVYGSTVFKSVGALLHLFDLQNTFTIDGTPAPRIVTVGEIRTAYQAAKLVIDAYTTSAEVSSYNVVTAPLWP